MDFTQFDRLISLTPASASPNEAIATTLDGRKVTLSVASFGEGVVRVLWLAFEHEQIAGQQGGFHGFEIAMAGAGDRRIDRDIDAGPRLAVDWTGAAAGVAVSA